MNEEVRWNLKHDVDNCCWGVSPRNPKPVSDLSGLLRMNWCWHYWKRHGSFLLVPWRLSRSGCKRRVSRTLSLLLLLLLPQGRKAVGGSPRQGRARACHRRSSHYMSALIGGYGSKQLSGEIFPRFGSRAPASVYFLFSSLRPMQIWSAEDFVYKVDFLPRSVDL